MGVSSQGLSRLGKKPSITLIQPVQILRATSHHIQPSQIPLKFAYLKYWNYRPLRD